jgi:hypothetical protein
MQAYLASQPSCTRDDYLRVSFRNSHLSFIKGIALLILSIEINLLSLDIDKPDPSVF